MKVLAKRFHSTGHTAEFRPHTQKLKQAYKTKSTPRQEMAYFSHATSSSYHENVASARRVNSIIHSGSKGVKPFDLASDRSNVSCYQILNQTFKRR